MTPGDHPVHQWRVRTAYLRRPARDLDDLVARPHCSGIDIVDDAEEARAHVRAVPVSRHYELEGFLELSIDGVEMFGPELWDCVHFLWIALVQLGADVIADGQAEQSFLGQSITMSLTEVARGRLLVFRVHKTSVTSDRRDFLTQLGTWATWYFDWYASFGHVSADVRDQIATILAHARR